MQSYTHALAPTPQTILMQAMNIGVALPDWMFATDRRVAPLMLLALVCVFVCVREGGGGG